MVVTMYNVQKDAAKQVITNANDLNQAQKDALKQQVDAAQTVANVNTQLSKQHKI